MFTFLRDIIGADTQFAAKWTPKKLLNVPLQVILCAYRSVAHELVSTLLDLLPKANKAQGVQEAKTTPFCPSQEKRNISDAL